jgi:hypothetical protein
MRDGPYKAVTRKELIAQFGHQCSPDKQREGYVIGPDTTGRLCHVASCFYYMEAVRHAEKKNLDHWKLRTV